MSGDCRLPLNMMKTKIKKSLQSLELENVVTRKDGYQEIINLIAQVSLFRKGVHVNSFPSKYVVSLF